METQPSVPFYKPLLRVWDLDENSTRYDMFVAAPSDAVLHQMWTINASFFAVFAVVNLVVLSAMLLSRRVRRQPFNVFVIFLIVPDLIFTGSCAITCAYLAIWSGGYNSPVGCRLQSFYLAFGLVANVWLNAVIALEIRRMLTLTHMCRRYTAPSRRMVAIMSLLCYLWACFVASWEILDIPWLPHATILYSGIFCQAGEYSVKSTFFYWIVFSPCVFFIPLGATAWICYDILLRRIIPPSGRRRQLVLYFSRIIMVLVVFWSVALIGLNWAKGAMGHPWVVWTFAFWGHCQGLGSTIMACMKEDIKGAVYKFVTCRTTVEDDANKVEREGGQEPKDSKEANVVGRIETSSSKTQLGRSQEFVIHELEQEGGRGKDPVTAMEISEAFASMFVGTTGQDDEGEATIDVEHVGAATHATTTTISEREGEPKTDDAEEVER